MYEVFEHTADIGLRIRGADLNELFAEAARGLASLIVENLEDVRCVEEREFSINGIDREYLLFDWLNELLFAFESDAVVFSQFDVKVTDEGLTATARGERADAARHRLDHEVKAITYHGLKIEAIEDGFEAEVIVDI